MERKLTAILVIGLVTLLFGILNYMVNLQGVGIFSYNQSDAFGGESLKVENVQRITESSCPSGQFPVDGAIGQTCVSTTGCTQQQAGDICKARAEWIACSSGVQNGQVNGDGVLITQKECDVALSAAQALKPTGCKVSCDYGGFRNQVPAKGPGIR